MRNFIFCPGVREGRPFRRVSIERFRVICRYDLSIEELIQRERYGCGDNDTIFIKKLIQRERSSCSRSQITNKHFPSKKQEAREREAILLCLIDPVLVSAQEVRRVMKHLKLIPGKPKELLSFIIDYPDLWRKKYPIVAIGQSWRHSYDGECVPSFDRGRHGKWGPCMDRVVDGWHGHYHRFLAFRAETVLSTVRDKQALACR